MVLFLSRCRFFLRLNVVFKIQVKKMNRDDQNLKLLYQISCSYAEITSFSLFCKRMNGLGNCVDVNCDVLIFVETLIYNIKSKCIIKKKKKTFIDYCLKNEEISLNLLELFVDRDFFDYLII